MSTARGVPGRCAGAELEPAPEFGIRALAAPFQAKAPAAASSRATVAPTITRAAGLESDDAFSAAAEEAVAELSVTELAVTAGEADTAAGDGVSAAPTGPCDAGAADGVGGAGVAPPVGAVVSSGAGAGFPPAGWRTPPLESGQSPPDQARRRARPWRTRPRRCRRRGHDPRGTRTDPPVRRRSCPVPRKTYRRCRRSGWRSPLRCPDRR